MLTLQCQQTQGISLYLLLCPFTHCFGDHIQFHAGDSQTRISSSDLSPELQTHKTDCHPKVCTWTPDSIKLNLPNPNVWYPPLLCLQSSPTQLMVTSSFQFLNHKILDYSFIALFLSHALVNSRCYWHDLLNVSVSWTLWEKARVGCFKRTALKHVYYLGWNRSPA